MSIKATLNRLLRDYLASRGIGRYFSYMLSEYLPILIHAIVVFTIGCAAIALASLLGPRTKSRQKFDPYECGLEQIDNPHKPIAIRFYTFALLFILFDIETIFLLPWAYGFKSLIGTGALPAVLFFLAILALGLFYILKTGALDWE